MQPRDAIDDGQAETRARGAIGASARLGRTRERLLEALDLIGRDTGAVVGHDEPRHAVRDGRGDLDGGRAVGERVVDEIGDQA